MESALRRHKQNYKKSNNKRNYQKYNKTPAQIALKFLLQRDIYIIPKSKNSDRLVENLDLNFTIDENDMNKLKKLDEGRSLFGWYSD